MAESIHARKAPAEVRKIYQEARAKRYQITEYSGRGGLIVAAVYDRDTAKALGIGKGTSLEGKIPQPSAVAYGKVREEVLRQALDNWGVKKKQLKSGETETQSTIPS